jgi:hypothetical protein
MVIAKYQHDAVSRRAVAKIASSLEAIVLSTHASKLRKQIRTTLLRSHRHVLARCFFLLHPCTQTPKANQHDTVKLLSPGTSETLPCSNHRPCPRVSEFQEQTSNTPSNIYLHAPLRGVHSFPCMKYFRSFLGKHKSVRFQNVGARYVVLDHMRFDLSHHEFSIAS